MWFFTSGARCNQKEFRPVCIAARQKLSTVFAGYPQFLEHLPELRAATVGKKRHFLK
jgi:hypothetical protein